jgi:hypothetical protein
MLNSVLKNSDYKLLKRPQSQARAGSTSRGVRVEYVRCSEVNKRNEAYESFQQLVKRYGLMSCRNHSDGISCPKPFSLAALKAQ